MSQIEDLRVIVSNGVLQNLFKAEEAILVNTTISYYSMEINRSPFKRILANLQRTNSTEVIICVSKIYEWSKRHNLRSIPAALKLLENNASEFEIFDRHSLIHNLIELDLLEEDVSKIPDVELTRLVSARIRNSLPRSGGPLKDIDEELKKIRDKQVAHSETLENVIFGITTYEDIEKYLLPAKNFMRLIGVPYLQTSYWLTDHFSFDSDANTTKVSLKKLLKEAGVIGK